MDVINLASWYYRLQPVLRRLPLKWQVRLASLGRSYFSQHLPAAAKVSRYLPPDNLARSLWGLTFQSPLMNAAGLFKNGHGYDIMAKLGAGAFLGGTSTANPRQGNRKQQINLPFIALPRSQAALNWLGLPNAGDEILLNQSVTSHKNPRCPVGWSVMRSPDFPEDQALQRLIHSLWQLHDNLQFDFIELNESCPNINHAGGSILPRLTIIGEEFLAKRRRNLPVILKLANDLTEASLYPLLECAVRVGFDGVCLGNTATNYAQFRSLIESSEQDMFNYFIQQFGGGLSGAPLRNNSLKLCQVAQDYLTKIKPQQEFHVIRCGGVSTAADLVASQQSGIFLNQWYTGLLTNWLETGDALYQNLYVESGK
jgi:dihydroorotate dehydrogenase